MDYTLPEKEAVIYSGNTDKIYYSAKFTDGSYCKNYVTVGKVVISTPEVYNDKTHEVTISLLDKFVEYKMKNKAVRIFNVSIDDRYIKLSSGLTDIYFKGTKAQWNAIEKGGSWNSGTGKYTIHCTDGNIKK